MSEVGQWSIVAADNDDPPPHGWPEDMPPGGVNDTGREMQAAMARAWRLLPWQNFGHVPACISSSAFTVAGNQRDIYEVGKRLRAYDINGEFVAARITDVDFDGVLTTVATDATDLPTIIDKVAVLFDLGFGTAADRDIGTAADQVPLNSKLPAQFPPGTRQIFLNATAPPGWVQVTDHHDAVLRVVSGSTLGTGGSWTLSGVQIGPHSLTAAEMPTHWHYVLAGGEVGRDGQYAMQYPPNYNTTIGPAADDDGDRDYDLMTAGAAPAVSGKTSSSGSGQPHTHELTIGEGWRPKYVDCIVCEKL